MVLSLFEEVVDRSVFLAFLVVEKGELNWSDENFEVEAILDHAVEEVNILSISVRFHFLYYYYYYLLLFSFATM